jgi:hypothetical protein
MATIPHVLHNRVSRTSEIAFTYGDKTKYVSATAMSGWFAISSLFNSRQHNCQPRLSNRVPVAEARIWKVEYILTSSRNLSSDVECHPASGREIAEELPGFSVLLTRGSIIPYNQVELVCLILMQV